MLFIECSIRAPLGPVLGLKIIKKKQLLNVTMKIGTPFAMPFWTHIVLDGFTGILKIRTQIFGTSKPVFNDFFKDNWFPIFLYILRITEVFMEQMITKILKYHLKYLKITKLQFTRHLYLKTKMDLTTNPVLGFEGFSIYVMPHY